MHRLLGEFLITYVQHQRIVALFLCAHHCLFAHVLSALLTLKATFLIGAKGILLLWAHNALARELLGYNDGLSEKYSEIGLGGSRN